MFRLLFAAALFAAAAPAAADPKTDYLLFCRGCHLHTGDPVPDANVPGLHELAPLIATAAGREYIVRVPGVAATPMSDARVAAVLNWVLTEFNADSLPSDFKPYSAEEVGKAREKVLIDPLATREKILEGDT